MGKFNDLTGKKFHRLTVISRNFNTKSSTKWNCTCDCGKTTTPSSYSLLTGKTKSCGCLQKEIVTKLSNSGYLGWKNKNDYRKQHGLSTHKLYYIYRNILERCYIEKNKDFKFYGARGIKVSDVWLSDFTTFYEWSLNHGWLEGLTIDRINNDGSYGPDNCRWITQSENSKKRHSSTSNNPS